MRVETGLGVLHLFAHPAADGLDHDRAGAAIEQAEHDGAQVVTAALLGHKADIAVMALHADWAVLRRLQTGLQQAGLDIIDSYVSITEVSEYAKGMPEHMLQDRLYPQLPPADKPVFCFYPMTKRREAHANWYATSFDERNEMMREHGKSGRTFAGKVVQLITGSTGLDDFEWGVTLFAVTPEIVKDVVYTMRFDKGSALYGEFGRFYVGYVIPPVDLGVVVGVERSGQA
ncbi:MAG: chlorite dismutase family protein [Desertimonas sp.]